MCIRDRYLIFNLAENVKRKETMAKLNEEQQKRNTREKLQKGDVIDMDKLEDHKVLKSLKNPSKKFKFVLLY